MPGSTLLQDYRVAWPWRFQKLANGPAGFLNDAAHLAGRRKQVIEPASAELPIADAQSDLSGHSSAVSISFVICQVNGIAGPVGVRRRLDNVGIGRSDSFH